ncbi:MAG: trypsin-like serine protease [Streptomycetaceae bacterium]|nr:trypsin-like serine protease [Streptomycetaceae bacterium]
MKKGVFIRHGVKRQWTLLTVTSVLAALATLVFGLQQTSQAAQGQRWQGGVPWAGVLKTNMGLCSVTVISEFLAITAKHCGTVNPQLKLNVPSWSTKGHYYTVKKIEVNRNLDVEALFLRNRTGLSVTPHRELVARDWFYAWGYGLDWSNHVTNHLTRADFNFPMRCSDTLIAAGKGSLCWETTAKDSVCIGDSGGPITQHGEIIAMMTNGDYRNDCSTVSAGGALTVREMQPWLDQMINDSNPFPS